jgi:hypothetical protein
MKVNTNSGVTGVGGPVSPKRPASVAGQAPEAASFAGATALETALKSTPDSRPEAVDRARELINDAAYPPAETMRKISTLLAANSDLSGE